MTDDCACGQSQGLCPHQQRDARLARYPDTMAWTLEILGAGPPAGQAGSLGLPGGERLAGQGIGEGRGSGIRAFSYPPGRPGVLSTDLPLCGGKASFNGPRVLRGRL